MDGGERARTIVGDDGLAYLAIPLRGRDGTVRAWTLVDQDDAPVVLAYRWHLDSHGYAITKIRAGDRRRTVLMHRLLLAPPDHLCIDHKNRCRLDNRRQNLRVVTPTENAMNVGAN